MSAAEKKNTLLVINLDNLIVGDKLYFNSGQQTPEAVRKLTRDRALAIARSHGIAAATNPGLNKDYPKGTGCCNDAEVFDKAGISVLSVEATNWNLGKKTAISSVRKRLHSRPETAGTMCVWITNSTSTRRYQEELNTAVAMSCASCCRW